MTHLYRWIRETQLCLYIDIRWNRVRSHLLLSGTHSAVAEGRVTTCSFLKIVKL